MTRSPTRCEGSAYVNERSVRVVLLHVDGQPVHKFIFFCLASREEGLE